ncbi:GPI transamidase component PIG-S-like isoform X2 [Denticeps clupeoides]|uniref:GPI transamidase component PIG-S-like isoform X2 n=1 Tax=Denticeps clupeoides TaxID=299321 RepID=UPI0010A3A0C3|nr:GPI transamidase component PIG-S-like isoform X2 [Denticeps clupeoides]
MAAVEVEKQRGRSAAVAIAALVIAAGIPLWWKTTETYRAWLPAARIGELEALQLELRVEVEVVFARGTLSPEQQKKVPASRMREQQQQVDDKTGLKFTYETRFRTATVMEEDALNQPTAAEADHALHTLTETSCGSVVIYIIPEASALLPQDMRVYVGRSRTALLRSQVASVVGAGLPEVLAALDPQMEQVLQTMSFNHQDVTAALTDRLRPGLSTRDSLADSMRAFKSSPGYEITFSLLNPDPKHHQLHWDVEAALDAYIYPLLHKMAPVANFSVDSQILYYAVLGVNPRYDASASAYTLSADSLAHVINPVEARLGSNAASSNPVLNFLLYVPDSLHSPLIIRNDQKQEVASNAFHSPRWGGIMVYNVDGAYGNDTQFPVDIAIDMSRVMGVFLSQLRLMLGFQQTGAPPGFVLEAAGREGVAEWELDRLLWSRSVENVATASASITSLAQLLDQIANIVINDNIAQQVASAVTALQAAVAELEAGNLALALEHSREAISASERAFFDPSLLHLLYFPDDQKFAIYIPLFLPMCVPILLSLLKIFREVQQHRAEKRAKRD